MNKFIAGLLAAVSISASTGQTAENIDVNSILYSMPTISGDEIEYQRPSKKSFEGAPQFHEDQWSQLEILPKSRLDEIKSKLSEYKKFELINRATSGWKEIYVRNISRNVFKLGLKALDALDGAESKPAPILTTASRLLGQVKGGFTVSLGDGALLYGIERDEKVVSLAASVQSDAGNRVLTNSFIALDKTENLILVDWRGQMIIMTGSNGNLDVWKP